MNSRDNSETIISLEHVSYRLPMENREILHDVNLKVKRGEIHIIKGPSGSGKTTLLQLCGSILYPSKGEVRIFDTISEPSTSAAIRSRIGFVFQTPVLFDDLTVIENFEVIAHWMGMDTTVGIERGKHFLQQFHLEELADQRPRVMSGGERQRVALILALLFKPSLLLLDEPLGSVDFKTQELIVKHLKDVLSEEKMTMIAVTHGKGLDDIGTHFHELRDGTLD